MHVSFGVINAGAIFIPLLAKYGQHDVGGWTDLHFRQEGEQMAFYRAFQLPDSVK